MNNQTNVNSESQKLVQLAAQFAFKGDIDNFSKVEHKLCGDIYLKHTDEENDFFDKFYLIQSLSRICLHTAGEVSKEENAKNDGYVLNIRELKWAIIFKGYFNLAHSDFLEEFLWGLQSIGKISLPYIVCIDSALPDTKPYKSLNHLPLYKLTGTREKITAYKKFAQHMDLSIWFACTQNMSLFMGNRFCKKEAIWSQKHLKMRPGSVDFLLTGGSTVGQRNDGPTSWLHGRCLAYSMRKILREGIYTTSEIKNKEHFIFSTVVRGEKLRSKNFWQCIHKILRYKSNSKLKIATSLNKDEIINIINDFNIDLNSDQLLIHAWQKSPVEFIARSDCYLDTFPMGSGLMGQYAVLLGKPYIGLNCKQTLKSSFAANLADFASGKKCTDLELLGLASTYESYIAMAIKQINLWSINQRSAVSKNQQLYRKELKIIADQYLMAHDYADIISREILK
jgi:hypothetical protein